MAVNRSTLSEISEGVGDVVSTSASVLGDLAGTAASRTGDLASSALDHASSALDKVTDQVVEVSGRVKRSKTPWLVLLLVAAASAAAAWSFRRRRRPERAVPSTRPPQPRSQPPRVEDRSEGQLRSESQPGPGDRLTVMTDGPSDEPANPAAY